jgi:peptidyl-prolyl cis-trans isomerase B (cyclophilin B)
VGTEKRERQKANRQLRLEEIAIQRKKADRKRGILKYALAALGIAVAIVVIAVATKKDDDELSTASTTIAAADGGSSTSVDPNAASTTSAAPGPLETAPSTIPGQALKGDTSCPTATSERTISFEKEPPMCIDPAKKYTAKVTTNKGSYTVTLDAAKAPKTVNNFVTLARYRYFDGTTCHRIIPGFVVQCGDPGTGPGGPGTGGPGYEFADELPKQGEYKIGSLAMANSGANTNGSQFFLITGDQGAALPPQYSLFGQADAGQDEIIKKLDAAGSPNGVPTKELVYIEKVEITEG